ncbi:hypothetical protein [Methylibium sp.]|uniref:hypothetical protein n=1 Tax=Methylibium sp. TaxID=2067992 RepID=UPI003D0D30B0
MKQQQGSLREVMPGTAEVVDWLRSQIGKEAADRVVLKGKVGRGGFYMAEIGPDGVFREFGSTKSGRRLAATDGRLVWSDEKEAAGGKTA